MVNWEENDGELGWQFFLLLRDDGLVMLSLFFWKSINDDSLMAAVLLWKFFFHQRKPEREEKWWQQWSSLWLYHVEDFFFLLLFEKLDKGFNHLESRSGHEMKFKRQSLHVYHVFEWGEQGPWWKWPLKWPLNGLKMMPSLFSHRNDLLTRPLC